MAGWFVDRYRRICKSVSATAHHRALDPAPDNRRWAWAGHVLADLVAGGGGNLGRRIRHGAGLPRFGVGLLLLFGWTLALFFHMCNGIRHLAWDLGFGFEKAEMPPDRLGGGGC